MNLRDHLHVLRRGLPLVIALPVLTTVAAGVVSAAQAPVYQATTSLTVSAATATSGTDLNQGGTYVQQIVKTLSDVVTKPIVLDRVRQSLDLPQSESQLAASIVATAPLNTTIIEITAADSSPQRAAAIAQEASDQLVDLSATLVPSDAAGKATVKVIPIQRAVVPSSPVSPTVSRNLALALVAGLALGLGLAYLWSAIDTRIRSARDVGAITGTPVVGEILADPRAAAHPLVVQTSPGSIQAEAFRGLRTNLQFIDFESGTQSFVVTSSHPGEGKTTTTANLALAAADAGLEVVLVDGDLRKPRVHALFGIEGGLGLVDAVIGRAPLDDVLQPWSDRLHVLPAGMIPPNPAELLQSRAMSALLDELRERYDLVVIDSPPLLPVSDAAVLARRTGGAIVVAAARRTRRQHLERALQALDQAGAGVLGVVVTMLPTKGPDSASRSVYGYGETPGSSAVLGKA
ncbi:polysaccharide biosynthesis tyrosine autokinase [Amnibacterium setariae]|uniref:polysaccharide biosynthesis tyrosine autokinase n=1 Tax=Amnibacterium setariae TaxID=2306585 RepID=UPI0011C44AB9|nr:polysaccharide biosynthesis tyrosine autokinase [Amnibacterium setariae]